MTVAELQTRVSELETRMATLEEQLEQTQIQAAIRRGRDEADQGKVISATELVRKLRSKHNIP